MARVAVLAGLAAFALMAGAQTFDQPRWCSVATQPENNSVPASPGR